MSEVDPRDYSGGSTMPSLTENLKQFLDDVERFITETIKDVKLTTAQAREKFHLEEQMRALQELISDGGGGVDIIALGEYDNNTSVLRDRRRRRTAAGMEDHPTEGAMTQEVPVAVIPARELYPNHCGWLYKKRKPGGIKAKLGPQKRWCCIKRGVFYYYLNDMSDKQQGYFHLKGYEVEKLDKMWIRLVRLGGRTFEFQALTEYDQEIWVTALTKAAVPMSSRTQDPLPPIPGEQPREGMFVMPPKNARSREDQPQPEPIEPISDIYDDTEVADVSSDDSEDYDDVEAPPLPPPSQPKPTRPPGRVQERPKSPVPLPRSPPLLHRPIPVPQDQPLEPDEENYDDVVQGDDGSDSDSSGYDDASSIVPPAHRKPRRGFQLLAGEKKDYDSGSMDEGFSSQMSDWSGTSFRSGVSSGAGSTIGCPPVSGPGVSSRGPLPPIPQAESPTSSFSAPTTSSRPVAQRPKPPPGTLYTKLYIARYNFHSVKEGELSFRRGEVIKVIDRTFDRYKWWTGKKGNQTGLVPKNYLQKAYQL